MMNTLKELDANTLVRLKYWLAGVVLCALVLVTALGVIYSSYRSRQLFSELEQLNKESIQLEEEWGRLLLEQSTWASHSRIERLAKTQLNMVEPTPNAIVVVSQ